MMRKIRPAALVDMLQYAAGCMLQFAVLAQIHAYIARSMWLRLETRGTAGWHAYPLIKTPDLYTM